MKRKLWPTPTSSMGRPNEGNVRLLRARVLDGTLTEEEAKAMLNGKSPFEAQGKLRRSVPSSPGSGASTSASSEPAGNAASKSNGSPSASESLPSTGPMFPDMETSTTSTGLWPTPRAEHDSGRHRGKPDTLHSAIKSELVVSPRSTYLLAAFPANRSALPDDEPGWRTIVGYGPSSREPFASYDPATSSWRTSQGSLWEAGWEPYSETWPTSGMMRNGRAFPRRPLVPRTSVIGSGSSERLPTPTADDADNVTRASGEYRPLTRTVMFPTPQASDDRDRGNLSMPATQRRREMGKQLNLSMVVSPISGALNPTWVEWLMGFPLGWTDLGPSATQSSRKSSNGSGDGSTKKP